MPFLALLSKLVCNRIKGWNGSLGKQLFFQSHPTPNAPTKRKREEETSMFFHFFSRYEKDCWGVQKGCKKKNIMGAIMASFFHLQQGKKHAAERKWSGGHKKLEGMQNPFQMILCQILCSENNTITDYLKGREDWQTTEKSRDHKTLPVEWPHLFSLMYR